jgi:hypothetical protein
MTDGMERRNFIHSVGFFASSTAAAVATKKLAFAQTTPRPDQSPCSTKPKPN